MSRHQAIKNLDLDDELDDFDGGEDYYDDGTGTEELSEEDQAQMVAGTAAVREVIGSDIPRLSDKEIQEALWHYYYDVEKSVNYLISSRMPKESQGKKKKEKKVETGGLAFFHPFGPVEREGLLEDVCETVRTARLHAGSRGGLNFHEQMMPLPPTTCTKPFIPKDFWKDMGWLNVPLDLQATFIEPLYPRGGLLGGSPDAVPKMSRLQALAAARKKKAQEQKSGSAVEDVAKPMAALTLGGKQNGDTSPPKFTAPVTPSPVGGPTEKENIISFSARKRKSSSPHRKTPQPLEERKNDFIHIGSQGPPTPSVESAEPSAFATTMFGDHNTAPRRSSTAVFTLPYLANPSIQSADAFAGPSPDDVVIAAQSKAAASKQKDSKKSETPPKTANEKKADQIANGVEAMRLDDTPKVKSKNLDVLKEFEKKRAKNAANFVVIGHVDAGKSTLMGRLLYDLGVVDQRTIDRYRKEAEKMGKSSFALAWVLDQGTEERSRGVTIDIATNKFETEKTAFTILDAPGHRDFIPNMIAGASQADFAVLVIDASTGSFESGLKGQTKEHALLVRSMGVQRLIIAINKLDTVSWSKDRFDEISQQVSAFLTAAGFQAKNVTYIPLSGLHGDNITRKSEDPAARWYTGPTLVDELDHSEPISRALDKPLRFTMGDVFRGGVQNPLSVSGRIDAGSLQTGDALLAQPSNQKAFIKSLEIDNEAADWAVAGQNVTINLSDIDPIHLKIGDVLCSPSSPIQCIKKLTIKVLAFEFLMPMGLDVHRGRLHAPGRLVELSASLDKASGRVTKMRPKIVKPGGVARVVVELESLVPLERGMRVVLRSGGETVAAGLLE